MKINSVHILFSIFRYWRTYKTYVKLILEQDVCFGIHLYNYLIITILNNYNSTRKLANIIK